jgi:hypothetical protein
LFSNPGDYPEDCSFSAKYKLYHKLGKMILTALCLQNDEHFAMHINFGFRRNYWSKLSKVIGILISVVGIEIPISNRNRCFDSKWIPKFRFRHRNFGKSKLRNSDESRINFHRLFDFVESKKITFVETLIVIF